MNQTDFEYLNHSPTHVRVRMRVDETSDLSSAPCEDVRAHKAAAYVLARTAELLLPAGRAALGLNPLTGERSPVLEMPGVETGEQILSLTELALAESGKHCERFRQLSDPHVECLPHEQAFSLDSLMKESSRLINSVCGLLIRRDIAALEDDSERALYLASMQLELAVFQCVVFSSGQGPVRQARSSELPVGWNYEIPCYKPDESHEHFAIGSPGASLGFRLAATFLIDLTDKALSLLEQVLDENDRRATTRTACGAFPTAPSSSHQR